MVNYKPKTCPRCNIEFTPTSPARKYCSPECAKLAKRESHREANRRYKQRHKGRVDAYNREYRKQNREALRQKYREYYAKNIEVRRQKSRENSKRWRDNNIELAREQQRQWRINNIDIARERTRKSVMKWRANNQDKAGAYNARRAQAELEGNATPQLIEAKWEASDKTCILCGDPIDPNLPLRHRLARTIEHLTPLIRGGRHDLDNINFAHRACNTRKRDKTLEEYREWRERVA